MRLWPAPPPGPPPNRPPPGRSDEDLRGRCARGDVPSASYSEYEGYDYEYYSTSASEEREKAGSRSRSRSCRRSRSTTWSRIDEGNDKARCGGNKKAWESKDKGKDDKAGRGGDKQAWEKRTRDDGKDDKAGCGGDKKAWDNKGTRCSICNQWIRSLDPSVMEWHQQSSSRCLQKQGKQDLRARCACGKWVLNQPDSWEQHDSSCPAKANGKKTKMKMGQGNASASAASEPAERPPLARKSWGGHDVTDAVEVTASTAEAQQVKGSASTDEAQRLSTFLMSCAEFLRHGQGQSQPPHPAGK